MEGNFDKVIADIKSQLDQITYKGDLSDIGNEIGIAIGKYISKSQMGYELDDFLIGVKHGVSLANDTHP